jgi:hypothetical protein
MRVETLRSMLAWCTLLNYAILLVWFFVLMFARGWVFRLHIQWFKLSEEKFDTLHYQAMAVYKIFILVFNLTPYLALRILT